MRKLATVRQIEEIKPIEGADAIEAARVGGWWVVVKRDEYEVGDVAVYLEIDSWVPHELAPFLAKGQEPKTYEGVVGNRLRTVRLRGQLSQGLLLPISVLGPAEEIFPINPDSAGADVTEQLGIIKWEPQLPAQLAGKVRGTFPGWMRKTDQERIQNCFNDVSPLFGDLWTVEEKLDGSSMTVGKRGADIHVCSRNLSIKLEDETNSFVATAIETGVLKALEQYPRDIAISGELCGEGIQKNRYALKGQQWFVFDIFDVTEQRYASYNERQNILSELTELGASLSQVPNIVTAVSLSGHTVDSLLALAEGKAHLNPKTEREGFVYKNAHNPDITFKAISNRFLLKNGE